MIIGSVTKFPIGSVQTCLASLTRVFLIFSPAYSRPKTSLGAQYVTSGADLPTAGSEESLSSTLNHIFIPGARTYPGHTGSPLDEPAKTLKAGVHGVPGGENMLVLYTGQVRYFTVREAARLQTFPDDYFFPHCWTQTMRQLGNAVPVALAEVIASDIRARLETVL